MKAPSFVTAFKALSKVKIFFSFVLFNIASKNTYQARSGYGNLNVLGFSDSPILRTALVDDAIISVAYGGSEQILDFIGLDGEISRALTGMALPLIAPISIRSGISGVSWVGNKLTDNVIQDFGDAINYVPQLISNGYIGRGLFGLSSDTQIRNMIKNTTGKTPTDNEMKSIKFLNKMFRNMTDFGRETAFLNLERYGDLMSRFNLRIKNLKNTRTGELVFTDEQRMDIMNKLNLSVAHATGLAPLIAVQNIFGRNVKPKDLTDPKNLDIIMNSLERERDSLGAISELNNILKTTLLIK